MTEEFSYGIVPVYRDEDDNYKYLIVQQTQGHWSFPKGHAEDGESPVASAKRELEEETGISAVSVWSEPYFDIQYIYTLNGEEISKTVRHFIGFVEKTDVVSQEDEIIDWKWATYEEAEELLFENVFEAVLVNIKDFLPS